MMEKKEETFEELVQEFISKSRKMVKEKAEAYESSPVYPFSTKGPPYEGALDFDEETIRKYALSIGDDNPLYTDPEYANRTRYGCQIAPGPMLALVRYPSVHGPTDKKGGYPVANFISGAAWEWFNVLRKGDRFKTTAKYSEFFEKGGGGDRNLLFTISDDSYWTLGGDLVAKCYATQIMVPIRAMGTSRSMDVDKLGTEMIYTRKAEKVSKELEEKIVNDIRNEKRRGSQILY